MSIKRKRCKKEYVDEHLSAVEYKMNSFPAETNVGDK